MLRTFTVACLLALSFVAVSARMARATEWYDWDHRQTVVYHKRHHYYRHPDRPDKEAREDPFCKDKVRGLGTQWIGTKGALDAAKKDWMERVRYDHGEKYVDMSHARAFESTCGRVSIGEVAGQVTYRCEVWARPCLKAAKENDE